MNHYPAKLSWLNKSLKLDEIDFCYVAARFFECKRMTFSFVDEDSGELFSPSPPTCHSRLWAHVRMMKPEILNNLF